MLHDVLEKINYEELAQWLRELTSLPENPGSIPNPYMWCLSIIYKSSSRGSNSLFCPLLAPGIHMTHKHICKIPIHNF